MSALTDNHVGVIFIEDEADSRVVGIISERDVNRHFNYYGPRAFDQPIAELISEPVIACERTDKLKTIASLMSDKSIRHVAVNGNAGDFIGVISSTDIELFSGKG